MLHPAGIGKALFELVLRLRYVAALLIEENRARARALIERKDVRHTAAIICKAQRTDCRKAS